MDDNKTLLEELHRASVDGDQEAAVFLKMFAPWVEAQHAERDSELTPHH